MRGITIDSGQWTAGRQSAVDSRQSAVDSRQSPDNNRRSSIDGPGLVERILNGDVSESTRATIDKATTAAQMAALTLGSPEFQKRGRWGCTEITEITEKTASFLGVLGVPVVDAQLVPSTD